MKTLLLFAHPDPQHSRTNRLMLEAAKEVGGITVADLYAEYPRYEIDIDREQRRLLDHEAVVFQFPLYWYSPPSLLKEWQDLVLENGFAYGDGGTALKGKTWLCAITAGASEDAYTPSGRHRFALRQLLAPVEATAHLCGMRFLSPYTLYGALAPTENVCNAHVAGYVRLLEALRDDRLDLDAAQRFDVLSAHHLDQTIAG